MPSTRAHLFNKSPYYDKQVLAMALMGTKYEEADLDYYHEKADLWSNKGIEQGGKGNKKIDWLATLKNWMLEAIKDGKLVKRTVEVSEVAKSLAGNLTNWQKEEENTPQQAPQPQQAIQLEIPVDWSERWEDCQEKAKMGKQPILNVELYDWLILTGKIDLSKEEKVSLFKRAKEKYILELTAGFTPQERHTLLQMKQPGWGNDPILYERVVKMSKILAVKEALYRSIQPQPAQ